MSGPLLRRRGPLRIPHGYDYCDVTVLITPRSGTYAVITEPTAHVALSRAGLAYLYERDFGTVATSTVSEALDAKRPRDARDLAQSLSEVRILGRKITGTATPGPDTPVGPNTIGIWTHDAAVSITSTGPDGRPLVFDYDDATRKTTTNIITALTNLGQQ